MCIILHLKELRGLLPPRSVPDVCVHAFLPLKQMINKNLANQTSLMATAFSFFTG